VPYCGAGSGLAVAAGFIFLFSEIMDIKQVSSFSIRVSSDNLIRHCFRDCFSNDPTAFKFQQRTPCGEVVKEFSVLESTAELSLNHALNLQRQDKDLVHVEVEKFSSISSSK
jgi:hypothetical protein